MQRSVLATVSRLGCMDMETEIVGPDDAPDLVLLHGGVGAGRMHWGKMLDALAERWRVHVPDLPGHGRTPLDGRPYGRELLVDALDRYLDTHGAPAHVAGFSMGGHTALGLAQRRPEGFASLTLIGVSIRAHQGLDGWRDRFDPDRLEAELPVFARHLQRVHEPQGGPDAWRDVCRRDAAGIDLGTDLDALARLDCPVLLVRGDRDEAVDPAQYAELRRLWDESEEFVVPAGGHEVQLTRRRIVTPGMLDFLRRAKGRVT